MLKVKAILFGALILFAQNIYAEKFSVLADIHVTPGNENETRLKSAVQEINAGDTEFVVLAGDLSNEGSDEQLRNVKSILDGLTKPIYVIPGNHENNWSQSASKTISDIWGNDRFVFETENLVFVGINYGPYMKMGDGHIKQEDLIWLKQELAKRCTSGKRVVSVNHYPINNDLDNCDDYLSVLQSFPTIIHLCGHYHTLKYYKGGDIDAFMCRALDMTKRNLGYGYTNIEITSDSIFLYNKTLGAPQDLQFAIPVNAKHPKYVAEKKEQYEMPQGYNVKCVYRDSASIFTRLGVDKNHIYFGNSLGDVKAITKSGGDVVWSFHTDASLFARPAVSKKYLIVPTSDKRILWCDKATGKILKEYPSAGPYVADGVIDGKYLYQGGYMKFECWDANKGELVWRFDSISNYCQASPTIADGKIYFGAWDTYLRCMDMKSGKLCWTWNNGKTANMLGPGNCVPPVVGNRVFIVAPDRYMTALDKNTGAQIWRTNFDKKYKVRESMGVTSDGKYVLAKTMDGELLAVRTETETPEVAFVVNLEFGYEHTPCIVAEVDGVAYLGSRTGLVAAVDLQNQKLLWKYKVGSSALNGFEIDTDGSLYLSLIEGAVWKISKTK